MQTSPHASSEACPPLVETRLNGPTQGPAWQHRARIVEAILRGSNPDAARAAVLLCAPAGYGKSVAMCHARGTLAARGATTGWISFERGAAPAADLTLYVMAALRRLRPAFGTSFFGLLADTPHADAHARLDAALRDISAFDRPVWLFLDDVDEADAHDLSGTLRSLISFANPSIRFVMAARDARRLGARLLGSRDQLHILNADTLAFDATETRDYLAPLAADRCRAVFTATGGWCAALRFARDAMRGRDPTAVDFSGRDEGLAAYLLEHVLSTLPPQMQDFLIVTSVMERLCADNCDALLGQNDSAAALANLHAANVFLTPLDSNGIWFRYHPLFREFLQYRLKIARSGEIASLQRMASQWFLNHRFDEEAMGLAHDTNDTEFVAATLSAIGDSLMYRGHHNVFLNAVSTLTPTVLERYPQLALSYSWIESMNWNFREARRLLTVAGDPGGEAPDALSCESGLGKTTLHRRIMLAFHSSEFAEAAQLSARWLESSAGSDRVISCSVLATLMLSSAYLLDRAGIAIAAEQARRLKLDGGEYNVTIWYNCILGLAHEIGGELSLSIQAYARALAVSRKFTGAARGITAMPAIFAARIHYEKNELDQARRLINAYPVQTNSGGLVDSIVAYTTTRARLLVASDHFVAATIALDEGIAFAHAHHLPRIAGLFHGERIRLDILHGHIDAAHQRIVLLNTWKVLPLEPGSDLTIFDAFDMLAWGRVMTAHGRFRRVEPVLHRWMEYCTARDNRRLVVLFELLIARGRAMAGDMRAAMRSLAGAVRIGADLGLIRTFTDEGALIRGLLVKLYEGDGVLTVSHKIYVRTLLSTFASNTLPIDDTDVVSATSIDNALSNRELEILALISEGLKGRFVGARLGITEGTVKWHMQRIFDKLGVRTQREAIGRARSLGMLE